MFIDVRESGWGRERRAETLMQERDTHIDWLPPVCALAGDWTHSLGKYPECAPNPHPFGVQDEAPTNRAA